MRQHWFVIDRWGRRSANFRAVNHRRSPSLRAIAIDWPEFNQLVTRAAPHDVIKALRTFASMLDVTLADTDDRDHSPGLLAVTRCGQTCVVSEIGVDLEDRLLRPESADAIFGLLADDGVFLGFDPSASTVHLTRYALGAPVLDWWDSALPGPSYARTFLNNGRATDEDPRMFALAALELPGTTPLLDREAFLCHHLEEFDLASVEPNLVGYEVVATLRMR